MVASLEHESVPPFPDDIPVAKLERVGLQALISGDANESLKLFEACRTAGFFLLDLKSCQDGRVVLNEVSDTFRLSKSLFDQENDQKMQYHIGGGRIYGYKASGAGKIDNKGTPDRTEVWAISKDGVLNDFASEKAPSMVKERRSNLKSLAEHAHAICLLILSHIERNLKMTPSSLTSLHHLHNASEDSIRLLKMPAQPEGDRRTSFMSHTDFGSVTLLFNILGGLQVHHPSAASNDEGWEYVKPEPGCCIVNLGDALTTFTSDTVRSNLHRVNSPPGLQAQHDRYSLAYFCRPENDVHMRPLTMGRSVQMKNGVDTTADDDDASYTMREWVKARTEIFLKGQEPMRSHGGWTEVTVV